MSTTNNSDVSPMIPVPHAIRTVLTATALTVLHNDRHRSCHPLHDHHYCETVPLDTHRIHDADHPVVGRVSAQQIVAPAPGYPNYEASVMDGYAVSLDVCRTALQQLQKHQHQQGYHHHHQQQQQHAVTFRITDRILAGPTPDLQDIIDHIAGVHAVHDDDPDDDHDESGNNGSSPTNPTNTRDAVYVATGAVIPNKYDVVIPIEDVILPNYDNHLDHSRHRFTPPTEIQIPIRTLHSVLQPSSNRWIRPVGCDIPPNTTVLDVGQTIQPVHIGLLRQIGVREVVVRCRPLVGVLSTGDELLPSTPSQSKPTTTTTTTTASNTNTSTNNPMEQGKWIRIALPKPMGIIFEPMLVHHPHGTFERGVRIVDLPPNGAAASSSSLSINDILYSVNDCVVVDCDLDRVMEVIGRAASGSIMTEKEDPTTGAGLGVGVMTRLLFYRPKPEVPYRDGEEEEWEKEEVVDAVELVRVTLPRRMGIVFESLPLPARSSSKNTTAGTQPNNHSQRSEEESIDDDADEEDSAVSSPSVSSSRQLQQPLGVRVFEIPSTGAAASLRGNTTECPLAIGDILLSIDDEPTTGKTFDEVMQTIWRTKDADRVRLVFLRPAVPKLERSLKVSKKAENAILDHDGVGTDELIDGRRQRGRIRATTATGHYDGGNVEEDGSKTGTGKAPAAAQTTAGLIRLSLTKPMGIIFRPLLNHPSDSSKRRGAEVLELTPGKPAALSKRLCLGDVLLSVNGRTVSHKTFDRITEMIRSVGREDCSDEVRLLFRRPSPSSLLKGKDSVSVDGSMEDATTTTIDDDEGFVDDCSKLIRLALPKPMGIVFEPLSQIDSDIKGVKICKLPPTAPAALSRTLAVGDVLLSVDDRAMSDRTFREIMDIIGRADSKEVRLLFRRPGRRKRKTIMKNSSMDEINNTSAAAPKQGQIPDANRPVLLSLLSSYGSNRTIDLGIASDRDVSTLTSVLENAVARCDVVITSGGISRGDADVVERALLRVGLTEEGDDEQNGGGVGGRRCRVKFGRLCMKPGKPTTFATVDREDGSTCLVFCLPGNPVSAYVCTELLVRPCLDLLHRRRRPIRKGGGGDEDDNCNHKVHNKVEITAATVTKMVLDSIVHAEVNAALTHSVPLDPERPEYRRVMLKYSSMENDGRGGFLATSTGVQRSSRLASMVGADGLMVMPQGEREEESGAGKLRAENGEVYPVLLLRNGVLGGGEGVRWGESMHRRGARLAIGLVTIEPNGNEKCPSDVIAKIITQSLGGTNRASVVQTASFPVPQTCSELSVALPAFLTDHTVLSHSLDVILLTIRSNVPFRTMLDVVAILRGEGTIKDKYKDEDYENDEDDGNNDYHVYDDDEEEEDDENDDDDDDKEKEEAEKEDAVTFAITKTADALAMRMRRGAAGVMGKAGLVETVVGFCPDVIKDTREGFDGGRGGGRLLVCLGEEGLSGALEGTEGMLRRALWLARGETV